MTALPSLEPARFVFAGQSLPARDRASYPSITFLPPARDGDLAKLRSRGPVCIGLLDGAMGDETLQCREILFAIACGIPVYGAAGLGAIRAVELESHGMVGLGKVYRGYRSRRFRDEADILSRPGTIAMVDLDATLDALVALGRIVAADQAEILDAARRVYFGDRTWSALRKVLPPDTVAMLRSAKVDRQRLDAKALLQRMLEPAHCAPPNCSDIPGVTRPGRSLP